MISIKFFQLTIPSIATRSDQIREQQVQMIWKIFIFNKSKRCQISDIKNNGQRYQLVHCYDASKTPISIRCQYKRLCDVLSWSVSLTYQLVHCYDVSNWSVLMTATEFEPITTQFVNERSNHLAKLAKPRMFYLRTSETSQKRLKQVRLIDVPTEMS